MFVLGIDPGLTRTGFGLIELRRSGPVAIRAGVLRTEPGRPTAERLAELADDLDRLVVEVSPDAISMERVFIRRDLTNAMSVARASGVAMLCAARAGVSVHEYTPSQVKATVAGHGGADKAQVTSMVVRRLRLAESPRPADAADALAIALCHLQQSRIGMAVS